MQNISAFSANDTRSSFQAKVYGLVAASLLLTAAVSSTGLTFGLSLGGSLVLMLASFGALFVATLSQSVALGMVGLAVFSVLQGLLLGPLVGMYLGSEAGRMVLTQAVALTAGSTLALGAVATLAKRSFQGLAPVLFAGLIVVVLASLMGLFWHSTVLQLTISAVSALVFSGYILVDVQRIARQGEASAVRAALSLYLDILNLFLALLRLLGMFSGKD